VSFLDPDLFFYSFRDVAMATNFGQNLQSEANLACVTCALVLYRISRETDEIGNWLRFAWKMAIELVCGVISGR